MLQKSGTALIAASIGGSLQFLTPREARAADAPFRVLKNQNTVSLLEDFCDALAPGAREAGVAHFIDDQLAKPVRDCLLIVRYLSVKAPFAKFYLSAIKSLGQAALSEYNAPFSTLQDDQKSAFIEKLRDGNLQSWRGPPASRVYFVLRSDAVDVVYGTEEGFDNLGVPYMPHIWPETRW